MGSILSIGESQTGVLQWALHQKAALQADHECLLVRGHLKDRRAAIIEQLDVLIASIIGCGVHSSSSTIACDRHAKDCSDSKQAIAWLTRSFALACERDHLAQGIASIHNQLDKSQGGGDGEQQRAQLERLHAQLESLADRSAALRRQALVVGLRFLDANGSGCLEPTDLPQLPLDLFARLDVNRRHAISPRDLLQAVSELEHSVDRYRRLLTTPPAEPQQLRTAPDARTEDQRVRDKFKENVVYTGVHALLALVVLLLSHPLGRALLLSPLWLALSHPLLTGWLVACTVALRPWTWSSVAAAVRPAGGTDDELLVAELIDPSTQQQALETIQQRLARDEAQLRDVRSVFLRGFSDALMRQRRPHEQQAAGEAGLPADSAGGDSESKQPQSQLGEGKREAQALPADEALHTRVDDMCNELHELEKHVRRMLANSARRMAVTKEQEDRDVLLSRERDHDRETRELLGTAAVTSDSKAEADATAEAAPMPGQSLQPQRDYGQETAWAAQSVVEAETEQPDKAAAFTRSGGEVAAVAAEEASASAVISAVLEALPATAAGLKVVPSSAEQQQQPPLPALPVPETGQIVSLLETAVNKPPSPEAVVGERGRVLSASILDIVRRGRPRELRTPSPSPSPARASESSGAAPPQSSPPPLPSSAPPAGQQMQQQTEQLVQAEPARPAAVAASASGPGDVEKRSQPDPQQAQPSQPSVQLSPKQPLASKSPKSAAEKPTPALDESSRSTVAMLAGSGVGVDKMGKSTDKTTEKSSESAAGPSSGGGGGSTSPSALASPASSRRSLLDRLRNEQAPQAMPSPSSLRSPRTVVRASLASAVPIEEQTAQTKPQAQQPPQQQSQQSQRRLPPIPEATREGATESGGENSGNNDSTNDSTEQQQLEGVAFGSGGWPAERRQGRDVSTGKPGDPEERVTAVLRHFGAASGSAVGGEEGKQQLQRQQQQQQQQQQPQSASSTARSLQGSGGERGEPAEPGTQGLSQRQPSSDQGQQQQQLQPVIKSAETQVAGECSSRNLAACP